MRTELGKISAVRFGLVGYQDCEFGLHLTFSMKGAGVQTTISGGWGTSMEVGAHTKWTEESRTLGFAYMARRINNLLNEAKVDDVMKLVGVPVEISFESLTLKSWRILTEVL